MGGREEKERSKGSLFIEALFTEMGNVRGWDWRLGAAGLNREFYLFMVGWKCLLDIHGGYWKQKLDGEVGYRSLEFRGKAFLLFRMEFIATETDETIWG